jgi:hypothetical protein
MANADRLPLRSQGATCYGTTRFGKYLAAGAGRKLDTVTCREANGLRLLPVMGCFADSVVNRAAYACPCDVAACADPDAMPLPDLDGNPSAFDAAQIGTNAQSRDQRNSVHCYPVPHPRRYTPFQPVPCWLQFAVPSEGNAATEAPRPMQRVPRPSGTRRDPQHRCVAALLVFARLAAKR